MTVLPQINQMRKRFIRSGQSKNLLDESINGQKIFIMRIFVTVNLSLSKDGKVVKPVRTFSVFFGGSIRSTLRKMISVLNIFMTTKLANFVAKLSVRSELRIGEN